MHVRMVEKEVEEAIREWLSRRGIEAQANEIEFRIKIEHARAYSIGDLAKGHVIVDVLGVELPIKEGPYR